MASREALAIQCDAACQRIETRMMDLVGEGLTPIPRTHRDREVLRRDQLNTIADWVDRIETDHVSIQPDPRLETALALLESGNWTKAQMEAALLNIRKEEHNGS